MEGYPRVGNSCPVRFCGTNPGIYCSAADSYNTLYKINVQKSNCCPQGTASSMQYRKINHYRMPKRRHMHGCWYLLMQWLLRNELRDFPYDKPTKHLSFLTLISCPCGQCRQFLAARQRYHHSVWKLLWIFYGQPSSLDRQSLESGPL